MSHFNEHALEMAIMQLFEQQGYSYVNGETIHKEQRTKFWRHMFKEQNNWKDGQIRQDDKNYRFKVGMASWGKWLHKVISALYRFAWYKAMGLKLQMTYYLVKNVSLDFVKWLCSIYIHQIIFIFTELQAQLL